MPMDRALYPDNWEDIALEAKIAADWTCQHCGVRRGDRQINRHGLLRRVVLTAAHLNHDPWNPDAQLEVLCWPCHARYDAAQRRHQQYMMAIARGQLVLPGLRGLYTQPRIRKQRQASQRPRKAARTTRRRRTKKEVKTLKA